MKIVNDLILHEMLILYFSKEGCEWVIVAIVQLYDGENKNIVNGMTITSTLYWTNSLSSICIVHAHGNHSPLIDMSPNSDTLSWFRANQFLPFLLNAACLAEKQHISIDNLWFYPIGDRTHDLPHSRQAC